MSYWDQKLDANQHRDQRNTRELQAAGWAVVRIWEHESVEQAMAAVLDGLRDAGSAATRGAPRRSQHEA